LIKEKLFFLPQYLFILHLFKLCTCDDKLLFKQVAIQNQNGVDNFESNKENKEPIEISKMITSLSLAN